MSRICLFRKSYLILRMNDPIQNEDGVIRSQQSRGLSFVRFCNATERKVDVIWINYEGARVRYKTLEPKEFVDVISITMVFFFNIHIIIHIFT